MYISRAAVAAARAAWAMGKDQNITDMGMSLDVRGPTLGLHTMKAQKIISLCWVKLTLSVSATNPCTPATSGLRQMVSRTLVGVCHF